jgi:hypothetical protein
MLCTHDKSAQQINWLSVKGGYYEKKNKKEKE